jgi:hypothetical protein
MRVPTRGLATRPSGHALGLRGGLREWVEGSPQRGASAQPRACIRKARKRLIFGVPPRNRRSRKRLTVLPHLTSYFYNWPVRIWPICRSEGAMGTYSPRFRGQSVAMPYHIPWPLCSLWWGEDWPGGAPGTDPPKIGVLECASSRTSARSRTGELGTFLLRTNHLRTVQVFLSAR